jgi:carboxyl-terminal processing protease
MHKQLLLFIFISCIIVTSSAQQLTHQQYKEDFEYFWNTIKTDYCYWYKKQTDWDKVKAINTPLADTITTRYSFVMLLERMFHELYDHHASLSTNTDESSKLVPSGTDIWAEYVNDKPIITEVKLNSGAEKAGIQAGMQVLSINGKPVNEAMQDFLGKSLRNISKDAKDYALRVALAGTHNIKRTIQLKTNNWIKEYHPDDYPVPEYVSDIETKTIGSIGYIRINNVLWKTDIIPAYDSAIDNFKNTSAIILDLRETPSGGNTTVARAIISRFINKKGYYQTHELTAEENEAGVKRSWSEIVFPRKTTYTKPLVLLVDHWTGSIAEGITIGFDAFKRATIIGTNLAALNGAIYSYKMPNSGIGFKFPVEKLFHVNGTPREQFKPAIVVAPKPGEDAILNVALKYLKEKNIK